MTTIRTNPLPLGVYWLDVFAPSVGFPNMANGEAAMVPWLAENAGSVLVKNREVKANGVFTPQGGGGIFSGPTTAPPAPFRFFYVFQVLKPPTNFPFEKLGFPTVVKLGSPDQILPSDTVTSNDTVQKPPPENALDTLRETLGTAGMYAAGALAVFLGYQLLFDRR